MFRCIYRYHVFICPSVDEHLGCFCIFAVANNALVNTEVHVSFSISRKPPVFKCIHLQGYFKSPQILCENEWKREREKKERRKKEGREEERDKASELRDVSEASLDGCGGWRSSCDSGLEGRQVSENTVTPFPGDCVTAFSGKRHPLNDLASKPLRTINGSSLLGWKKTCSSLLSSYFWAFFFF